MTKNQFVALMDLAMCSDPWPVLQKDEEGSWVCDHKNQRTIESMLDREANRRGFDSWIVAFHEMPKQ